MQLCTEGAFEKEKQETIQRLTEVEKQLGEHLEQMLLIKWRIENLKKEQKCEKIERVSRVNNFNKRTLINLAEIELKALERKNRPGGNWARLRRRVVRKDEEEDPPLRLINLKKKMQKMREQKKKMSARNLEKLRKEQKNRKERSLSLSSSSSSSSCSSGQSEQLPDSGGSSLGNSSSSFSA